MKITEATYQIVTPMFIGDIDQGASGISPASVKGALRFWWRALHWGPISAGKKHHEALALLHEQEGELFGSAADKNQRQGQFLLRVKEQGTRKGKPAGTRGGMQYLSGIGLYNFKKGFQRTAILSGKFTIQVVFKPCSASMVSQRNIHKQQLTDTLLAFGLLGGLGSRARRGLGSVSITSLKVEGDERPLPKNQTEYIQRISTWLQNSSAAVPPFTALSSGTRIDISLTDGKPGDMLEEAGGEMQMYRSYGRQGKVNGTPSEKNFEKDHDDLLTLKTGKRMKAPPARAVFGLPHNYYFSSSSLKVDIAPNEKNRGRRASPLMMHVHQFPNSGESMLVQGVWPAEFLPDGDKIDFKATGGQSFDLAFREEQLDWTVLTRYLDRFEQRKTIHSD